MKPKIVYSSYYDFGGWGIDKLHPFDGKNLVKPGSVFKLLYRMRKAI